MRDVATGETDVSGVPAVFLFGALEAPVAEAEVTLSVRGASTKRPFQILCGSWTNPAPLSKYSVRQQGALLRSSAAHCTGKSTP